MPPNIFIVLKSHLHKDLHNMLHKQENTEKSCILLTLNHICDVLCMCITCQDKDSVLEPIMNCGASGSFIILIYLFVNLWENPELCKIMTIMH